MERLTSLKEGWCFIDKGDMKNSYMKNLAKALKQYYTEEVKEFDI